MPGLDQAPRRPGERAGRRFMVVVKEENEKEEGHARGQWLGRKDQPNGEEQKWPK